MRDMELSKDEIKSIPLGSEPDRILGIDRPLSGTVSVRRRVMDMVQHLPRPVRLFICISILFGILCAIFHGSILAFFNGLSTWLKSTGVYGLLLCMLLTIIASFPFTIGYAGLLLTFGLTYGFPYGFIPAYISTMIGAYSSFVVCRRYFSCYITEWLSKTTSIVVTKSIMAENQLQTLLALRLAPIPFGMNNCFCSGLDVSTKTFILATGLVQFKIIFHIYAGHALAALASSSAGNHLGSSHTRHWIEFVISISMLVVSIVLSSYLYWKYQKRIEDAMKLNSRYILETNRVDHDSGYYSSA
jgi:uncharacterized membrane protein YdjX (TVP38/TMEM64 family)